MLRSCGVENTAVQKRRRGCRVAVSSENPLAELDISGPLGVHVVLAVALTAERAPRSARRGSEASRGAAEACLALVWPAAAKSTTAAA